MHILFVNKYSFSYLGGVEVHILNLAKELRKNGHRVTLVCQDDMERGRGWVPNSDDIRVVKVSGLLELYDFIRREASTIDVCHAHLARSTFASSAVFIAWWFDIPAVFTPHCFYPSASLRKRTLKWFYDATITRLTFRLCSRVINLTPQDQWDAVQRGMPLAKSQIIPNSINVTKLLNTKAAVPFAEKYDVQCPYLLHVGRFHKTKCIDFLIRNIEALEGMSLVLIGQDDGSLEKILELVRTLGLQDRIYVIQRVEFEELCSAYRDALALVIASVNEGLPTVLLEAAAFGLPTVAPRVGGIPFVIEDRVNGYLYKWGDRDGYIECVRRAVADRENVGKLAKATLVERFSWEVNAKKITETYFHLTRCGAYELA
jgi:glycosyltransferase involved in cell wall biosynthesis